MFRLSNLHVFGILSLAFLENVKMISSFATKSIGYVKPNSIGCRHNKNSNTCTFMAAEEDEVGSVDMGEVGFVLLAGGTGSRMKANMPKQFLELSGQTVLQHSLDLFLDSLPAYLESEGKTSPPHVVLVMNEQYQPDYEHLLEKYPNAQFSFASPGEERQGSVENGLDKLIEVSAGKCEYIAVHDSARPLVTIKGKQYIMCLGIIEIDFTVSIIHKMFC